MGKYIRVEEFELPDEEIESRKLFNVYLFGLPRSGTSMTTHILELLGVNMIYLHRMGKDQNYINIGDIEEWV